jgi:uncharacterized membrane protein YoaK (UPF0700 family)
MKKIGEPAAIAALLSFNGGFVDTAGFLGLAGLFTAHVTGNFVTLAAALVFGSHGIIGKLLALPAFILVIALARFAGAALRARHAPVLRIFLAIEVSLLVIFFALAVTFGPFPHPDSPAALLTGFAAIAAMALQNAVHRVHLSNLPPSTVMTGTITQATIDAVDLISGADLEHAAAIRTRFGRLSLSILYFAAGCTVSAALYWAVGFWCLALAVVVGAVAALMQAEVKPPAAA